MKILITDKLHEEGLEILRDVNSFDIDIKLELSSEELKKNIKDYDAIIIRSMTNLNKDIIESSNKLKVIGRAGVGLDNVDIETAKKRGIILLNTPFANTISTAEHTMGLMIALSRKIPQSVASLKSGIWDRHKFIGNELFEKNLGIIGLGRIGQRVAFLSRAFGMKVFAYDPYLCSDNIEEDLAQLVDFERLLKVADYISLHIPETPETTDLMSYEEFDIMKNNAMLINCARGGIVNEDALIDALKNNKILGAAIDVLGKEPPNFNSSLFDLDNCIIVPHLGAATYEAKKNVSMEIAGYVKEALLKK